MLCFTGLGSIESGKDMVEQVGVISIFRVEALVNPHTFLVQGEEGRTRPH